jgi:hypothetical protein
VVIKRILRVLGGVLTIALALPLTASAAVSVTFVAPSGAHVYADQAPDGPVGFTEAPTAIRTTDPRPLIGIEADGGTQLQCHFDSVFVTEPCGAPEPGCNAALCGSYQPASPLTPDSSPMFSGHFLAVDVLDADGNPVTSVWLNLDVDTAAPITHLDSVRGVLFVSDPNTPLRPPFTFSVRDGNDVGGDVDRIECSWQPAGTPPAWYVCASRTGTTNARAPALPARHRLYLVQVRARDDFGRSTASAAQYDPVPCAITVHRPINLAQLFASGIPLTVDCDAISRAAVGVYSFGFNGRRTDSPRGAVSNSPLLGQLSLGLHDPKSDVRRRLRLFSGARRDFRPVRSLDLVIVAGDPDAVSAGIADDSLSYRVLTLRR